MKIRYMIDAVLKDQDIKAMEYEAVGVWLQAGNTVAIHYLDKGAGRKQEADQILLRMRQAGVTELPQDFLEHWQAQRSIYEGAFSKIEETTEFQSLEEAAKKILTEIS
jgi:uncharacterized beta-barrel protein YwiB (DUF1934 family)